MIRAVVGVARVVGRYTEGVFRKATLCQIDSQLAVGKDRVAENRPAGAL